MNQHATAAESRYMGHVKALKCAICKRFPELNTGRRSEVHHIAKGSSRQNNWLVVALCDEHHRGGSGLHGMGERAFCSLYRVPHGSEYGLLAWTNQDLMEALGLKKAA